MEVMQYRDFPVESPRDKISFWHHADFCKYLQHYAAHYDVTKFIRFNTEVLIISPAFDGDVTENGKDRFMKWRVESKNLDNGKTRFEVFDAVLLCTGLFSTPYYAPLKKLENFKGEVLHSKFYDDSANYHGKVIAVYGQGPSAYDIIVRINKYVKCIYLCKRSVGIFKETPLNNVIVKPDIKEINESGEIVFVDGSVANADILMFCTGYRLSFPLSPQCKVVIEENLLKPAYKHMFHAIYPSMVFISLATFTGACLCLDYQCSYVLSVFTNKCMLPSQSEMLTDIEEELAKKDSAGIPRNNFHLMALDTFRYANYFASLTNEEEYPESKKEIFEFNLRGLIENFFEFSYEYDR